jgi:ACR3 family arsenite efflux pump ArsB
MVIIMPGIDKIEAYMKKYLLLLTIIVLLMGTIIGHYEARMIKENRETLKYVIITLAIATLYPSMVKLRIEKLGEAIRNFKTLIEAIVLTLIVAPLISMAIATCLPDPSIRLGYVAANIVPASSASVGYVLLAEGNIELATSLVFITILGSLVAGPIYLEYYGSLEMIKIPISKIVSSMMMAILTSLIIGQITRYYLVKKRHVSEKKIKPYLSLATMTCMLALIFLLIMSKAEIITNKPSIAFTIIGGQATIILIILGLLALFTGVLKISYEEHVAIAYTSISKNESAATIISAVALGGSSTVAPAIIPAIQPVLCILYLHLLSKVKRQVL